MLAEEDRMNIHRNVRLTPKDREMLISRLERGEHPMDLAKSMGVSMRTVYKWRRRYREEGFVGLQDRSSRPIVSPTRTPGDVHTRVIALRRKRRLNEGGKAMHFADHRGRRTGDPQTGDPQTGDQRIDLQL